MLPETLVLQEGCQAGEGSIQEGLSSWSLSSVHSLGEAIHDDEAGQGNQCSTIRHFFSAAC